MIGKIISAKNDTEPKISAFDPKLKSDINFEAKNAIIVNEAKEKQSLKEKRKFSFFKETSLIFLLSMRISKDNKSKTNTRKAVFSGVKTTLSEKSSNGIRNTFAKHKNARKRKMLHARFLY